MDCNSSLCSYRTYHKASCDPFREPFEGVSFLGEDRMIKPSLSPGATERTCVPMQYYLTFKLIPWDFEKGWIGERESQF